MSAHYSIQDQVSHRYWQIGEWVRELSEATKYATAAEADMVAGFKGMTHVQVVPNDTPFIYRKAPPKREAVAS